MSRIRRVVIICALGIAGALAGERLYAEMCMAPHETDCQSVACVPGEGAFELIGEGGKDCFCESTTEYVNCERIDKDWECLNKWGCTNDCSSCGTHKGTEMASFCATD